MDKKKYFYISVFLLYIIIAVQVSKNTDIKAYFFTITLASLFYFISILILFKIDFSSKEIASLILLSLIFKLMFLQTNPVGSDDYFRYLWDGKVLANGINPFKYSPNSTELIFLKSALLPDSVTYAHLKTIYFPLSQAAFLIAYWVGGESIIGLKIVLLAADLLITFGFYLLLNKNTTSLKYILIYSLSPLIIYQFFIDAHIDLLGIMFIVFMFYFFKNKKVLSAIFLSASIAVKPTFIFAIPILFFTEKKIRDKFKWLIIPSVFLIVSFIPFLIDANPFETLINYSKHWTFNGLIYNLLTNFFDNNFTIRIISLIVFIVIYIILLVFNRKLHSSIYYSLLALLMFSPIVHPWYVTWLIAILIIHPQKSGIIFLTTVTFTFYTVYIYQTTGVWKDFNWVLIIEYVPVIVLLLNEFYRSNFLKTKFNKNISFEQAGEN